MKPGGRGGNSRKPQGREVVTHRRHGNFGRGLIYDLALEPASLRVSQRGHLRRLEIAGIVRSQRWVLLALSRFGATTNRTLDRGGLKTPQRTSDSRHHLLVCT